jgi:hypothetical protein
VIVWGTSIGIVMVNVLIFKPTNRQPAPHRGCGGSSYLVILDLLRKQLDAEEALHTASFSLSEVEERLGTEGLGIGRRCSASRARLRWGQHHR